MSLPLVPPCTMEIFHLIRLFSFTNSLRIFYNVFLSYSFPLAQPIPDPLTFPILPTLGLIYFLNPLSLICPAHILTLGCVVMHRGMVDLPVATSLKRKRFSLPAATKCQQLLSMGRGFLPTSPLHLVWAILGLMENLDHRKSRTFHT